MTEAANVLHVTQPTLNTVCSQNPAKFSSKN